MAQIYIIEELTSELQDEVLFAILVIALIFGLLLVFAGRILWKPIMSIIGGFIGATLGYIIGLYFDGILLGLLGAVVGGLIGSLLFRLLVEFALSVLAGVVAFGVVFGATGNWLISFIALILVFILSSFFMEKIIGILTAVIGAILVGVCLTQLDIVSIESAVVISLVLIVLGSVIQMFFLERKAAPTLPPTHLCPQCGSAMSYDQYNNRWYCRSCDLPPPPPPPDTW